MDSHSSLPLLSQLPNLDDGDFNFPTDEFSEANLNDYDLNDKAKELLEGFVTNGESQSNLALLNEPYQNSLPEIESTFSVTFPSRQPSSRYHPYLPAASQENIPASYYGNQNQCQSSYLAYNVSSAPYSYPCTNQLYSSSNKQFITSVPNPSPPVYQDSTQPWRVHNPFSYDMNTNNNNNNINGTTYCSGTTTQIHYPGSTVQSFERTIAENKNFQTNANSVSVPQHYYSPQRAASFPFRPIYSRMMEVESASSPEVEIVEDTNGQKSSTDVKKRGTKKRKKKGANEPQKPVSAYALFFRDTQAAIKQENPSATFGEISKIVASMWDSLSEDAKLVYKRKTETAKRDYLKQLAAYRANLVSRGGLDVDEEDSTPLSVLKLKMTDQRSSPNLHQDLPPPPKLQMAPTVVRGIQIQHQAGCTPLDVPLEPNSASIVSGSDESRDSQPITSAETSPSIPVQHIILRSVPAPNLPPIQLRNIVPKPLPTVTLLQSKPGQVIKLLPSSQASSIAQMSGGQNRIIKMSDLIRNSNALTSQPANVAENNVQPILQTLAQEHETCLQDEDFPMNNGVQHPGEVPSASQPAVTTVASIHPNNDTSSSSVRMCKRDGCLNPAVSDPQWNEEYCSSECVVYHCRDVFDAWASVRQVSASVI